MLTEANPVKKSNNNSLFVTADRNIVREIKEQHCYVALNFQKEAAAAVNTPKQFAREYQLPDGKNITIGSERFLCPEVLFQPPLFGMECRGVHEGLLDSISKCPEYLRQVNRVLLSISGCMKNSCSY